MPTTATSALLRVRKRGGTWRLYKRPTPTAGFRLLATTATWQEALAGAHAELATSTTTGPRPAPCSGCGRPTLPKSVRDRPDGVLARASHTECNTCYGKRRHTEGAPPPVPRRALPAPCAGTCGQLVATKAQLPGHPGAALHNGHGMCAPCLRTARKTAPHPDDHAPHPAPGGTGRAYTPRTAPTPPRRDPADPGPGTVTPAFAAAAARTVARHATSPEDQAQLMAMLGLTETDEQVAQ